MHMHVHMRMSICAVPASEHNPRPLPHPHPCTHPDHHRPPQARMVCRTCVCVYGRYCGNDSPGGSPAWDPLVSPPVSPLGACSPFAPAQSPPQHAALHATTARAHPFGAAWLAEGRSGAARPAADGRAGLPACRHRSCSGS